MTTFAKIFDKNKYDIKGAVHRSSEWYAQEINKLKSSGRMRAYYLMRGQASSMRSDIIPGELYMYYYDAKHKDTLPYWDKFPLVFPFRKLPDGFLGLNMHYLPYSHRMQLLDNLLNISTRKELDNDTKLKFSWATIQSISKRKMAEQCVKHYLTAHVRSQFRRVSPEDWATAMMLPVQQFVSTSGAPIRLY